MLNLPKTLKLPGDFGLGGFMCGPTAVAVALGLPVSVADAAFKQIGASQKRLANRTDAVSVWEIGRVLKGFGARTAYLDLEHCRRPPTVAAWLRERPEIFRRSTVVMATQTHVVAVRGGQVVCTFGEQTELNCGLRRARVCDTWRIIE